MFRNTRDLKPGDILLCYNNPETDFLAKIITDKSGSDYCHAAIYYAEGVVAESRALDGWKKGQIVKTCINKMISRYEHVAVLRQPDAWYSSFSISALKLFIETVLQTGAKYNFMGALTLKSRKELHEANIHNKLEDFFNKNNQPVSPNKNNYFCSEFVADCYIATGFIQPSAAIVYQSDTYFPGDLGKDATFGTFWGYLTEKSGYRVNESDYYYHAATSD